MSPATIQRGRWVAILIAMCAFNGPAHAAKPIDSNKARIVDYWTNERRANAVPRDLVIDQRGLGYLRRPGGGLEPYGHSTAALEIMGAPTPSPFAKPGGSSKPSGGSSDTTPPTVANMDPSSGQTIGASATFSAMVTDDSSGVRSVSFKVWKGNSRAHSYAAMDTGGGVWSINFSGFTDGDWFWQVVAKDNAGNTKASDSVGFKVDTATTGTGTGLGTVTNAQWVDGGTVQTAAGRLYFQMPSNPQWSKWSGYVCSGTVATDNATGRSIIITASHCVYDDVNKAFARNVLFIPNQDGTTGAGTDLNCNNDPMGCWVPSFGVVDANWTTRTFPDNIAWDYAFYVVGDSGAHSGATTSPPALDAAAGSLQVSFNGVAHDSSDNSDYTDALGYSYSDDPNFMYCAEDMTTNGAVNWWLPSCGLSGGSSGGPWMQPVNAGSGPIISVNSWGYTTSPGMAGPKLVGTSAECIFNVAKTQAFPAIPPVDGNAGTVASCPQ